MYCDIDVSHTFLIARCVTIDIYGKDRLLWKGNSSVNMKQFIETDTCKNVNGFVS
jgi:hypothetical protein